MQVIELIKPIASVKKLPISLILAPDLPNHAIGDEKRLMQTLLNVVGNAVKYTKEGYVSIRASVAKPESLQDWRPPEFYPASSDGHFYIRVQVPCASSISEISIQSYIYVIQFLGYILVLCYCSSNY